MFYGDDQSGYTDMRASFGPFGGALAAGAMGRGGYGPGYGQGMEGPQGGIITAGAAARPLSYMPQAFVMPTQGGQFVMRGGLRRSFGYATGFNEPPRNVSAYELQLGASGEFAERMGTGAAAAGITGAGLAIGTASMGVGAAAGGVVGAGIGGFIAGPMGALAGAKVGAVIGGFAAPLIASGVSGGVSDLVSQQREIRNYMEASSFRFVGAGSDMMDQRMGRGMNTRGRRETAEMMTQMDVSDRFLNLDELGRIMKSGSEQGIFTGTQGMDDFKKKFKTLTENVKEVAKAFNTSLEDAVKVVRDMRSMGMEPGQTRQMVSTAESFGRVAGRTASEMFAVGQQGAEMFRGTGVAMQVGFQSAQATLASVRAARDAGILSQEAIAQAGGEEALSQRMVASSVSSAQSMYGRGTLMSMTRDGKFDSGALDRLMAGGSLIETAMGAAQNINSPTKLMQFQAHQAKNTSELGKMFGGQGLILKDMASLMQQAEYMQQAMPGLGMEDAFRANAVRQGRSEPEVETMLAMMKNANKDFSAKQTALRSTYQRQKLDSAYSNFMFTRVGAAASDVWTGAKNLIAQPINRAIDDFSDMAKDFQLEQVYGSKVVDLSDINVPKGLVGDVKSQRVAAEGTRARTGPVSLDVGGLFARTRGEQARSLLEEGGAVNKYFGGALTSDVSEMSVVLDVSHTGNALKGAGLAAGIAAVTGLGAAPAALGGFGVGYLTSVLTDNGTKIGTNKAGEKALLDAERVSSYFTMSQEQMDGFKKADTYKSAYSKARQKAVTMDWGRLTDTGSLARTLLGKDVKDLTPEDAVIMTELANKTGNERLLGEMKDTHQKTAGIGGDIAALDIEAAKKEYLGLGDLLKSSLTITKDVGFLTQTGGGTMRVEEEMSKEQRMGWVKELMAAHAEKDPVKREEAIQQAVLNLAGSNKEMSVPEINAKVRKNLSDKTFTGAMEHAGQAMSYMRLADKASDVKNLLANKAIDTSLSGDTRKTLGKLGSSIDADNLGERLASASEEEIKALSAGDKGTALLAQKLSGAGLAAEAFRKGDIKEKDFTDKLNEFNVSPEMKGEMVTMAKQKQSGAITNALAQVGLTGETEKLSVGMGANARDGGQGTPGAMSQEVMMTQNSILAEVKNVLLQMEKRLASPK